MPTRIYGSFDSYDIVGKSLPGIAFLLGILTYLPNFLVQEWISTGRDLPESLLVFIIIITFIVLVGVLIGEGVHTIAVNIELMFGWLSKRAVGTKRLLFQAFPGLKENIERIIPEELDRKTQTRNPLWKNVFHNWTYGMWSWMMRRYRMLSIILLGHRHVFERNLKEDIDVEQLFPDVAEDDQTHQNEQTLAERLERHDTGISQLPFFKRHFIRKCLNEFHVNWGDLRLVYPVITSTLENEDFSRSQKFQATYAFCRAMWVNSFLLAISYLLLIFYPKEHIFIEGLLYTSIIRANFDNSHIGLIIIILFLIMGVFMDSSGRYKQYYVEYLIAETYTRDRILGHELFDRYESFDETEPSETTHENTETQNFRNSIMETLRDKFS